MLFLHTLQHFAVDGICGAVLAAYAVNEIYLEPIIYFFGLYNLIAFGSQWLIGLVIDKKFSLTPYAFIISLITLALGTIGTIEIIYKVILIGIGNSLFHVAGGSLILRRYSTYKELGIFVSSGAIGLALGLNQIINAMTFLIIYAIITAFVLKNLREVLPVNHSSPQNNNYQLHIAHYTLIILLLACVILRSFGGSNDSTEYIILFPCVFAFGKMIGGLCCDKIGFNNTILLIFVMSFVALQFNGLMSMIILTLAFNMTMPLTLRLVHFCNPNYPGLMFGLAAGCLLPGAFFSDNFKMIPQAMIVIQFLSLFIAGYLFKKYSQRQIEL